MVASARRTALSGPKARTRGLSLRLWPCVSLTGPSMDRIVLASGEPGVGDRAMSVRVAAAEWRVTRQLRVTQTHDGLASRLGVRVQAKNGQGPRA
jgi:hypothetical protein